jgi:hypothetical protein
VRPLILLLAILVLADLTQCGGSTPRINWPQLAQCGAHDAPEELLQAVADTLLGDKADTSTSISDRAVEQLTKLAEERGAMVVECFVDEVVRGFDSQGGKSAQALMAAPIASAPTPAQLAAARGRDFLQRVARARIERP